MSIMVSITINHCDAGKHYMTNQTLCAGTFERKNES